MIRTGLMLIFSLELSAGLAGALPLAGVSAVNAASVQIQANIISRIKPWQWLSSFSLGIENAQLSCERCGNDLGNQNDKVMVPPA
jgi:hypothetical protein